MNFSKKDFWCAAIAGELIALLALPVLKNLGIFYFFTDYNNKFFYFSLFIWIIFLPLAMAGGLYIIHAITFLRRLTIYQIGKYGIIGLLNTFLGLGMLNFLILISGIARGIWFDFFVVIAFCASVTNAFFWNKFWTFDAKKTEKIKKEYAKFFIISGFVALINVFLMHLLVNVIGAPFSVEQKIWANIAFVFMIPVSFFGNFFGWKILVFKA